MENSIETQQGHLTESRRKFIEKVGITAVLGTFGVSFFTSCTTSTEDADPNGNSNNNTTPNGITVVGSTIKIDLQVQTNLNTSGRWLLINEAKTLVANINGSFVAMSSVCTHSGCADSWSFANNRFTCTCHNSIFDATGKVLQGPASSPLPLYTATVNGGILTISK
jgi:cytochrome b6-f complex iron-sulfur subunit